MTAIVFCPLLALIINPSLAARATFYLLKLDPTNSHLKLSKWILSGLRTKSQLFPPGPHSHCPAWANTNLSFWLASYHFPPPGVLALSINPEHARLILSSRPLHLFLPLLGLPWDLHVLVICSKMSSLMAPLNCHTFLSSSIISFFSMLTHPYMKSCICIFTNCHFPQSPP